jgi:hypothetical protein
MAAIVDPNLGKELNTPADGALVPVNAQNVSGGLPHDSTMALRSIDDLRQPPKYLMRQAYPSSLHNTA